MCSNEDETHSSAKNVSMYRMFEQDKFSLCVCHSKSMVHSLILFDDLIMSPVPTLGCPSVYRADDAHLSQTFYPLSFGNKVRRRCSVLEGRKVTLGDDGGKKKCEREL